jgi:predicted N-formylglutamate amidohydrolase
MASLTQIDFGEAAEVRTSEVRTYHEAPELLVTVHSFNPTDNGQPRAVELGVLHGADADFAKAMLDHLPKDTPHLIRMNARYSAADGVVNRLDKDGQAHRLPRVMIDIRNDLIQKQNEQACCAEFLAQWIKDTAVVEELFT